MPDGHPIKHTDDGAPQQAPDNGTYTAPTSYAPFPAKDGVDSDGRKYGPIERRGIEIEVSSPVDDVETLFRRTHLTAQFHAENSDYWTDITWYENDGGKLYDEVILSLCEEKLELEEIYPAELDIPERRLKTLFLRLARGQKGTELHTYLSGSDSVDPIVHKLLGYEGPDDIPSYNVLQREFRDLDEESELNMDAFQDAVTRAVYAAYRAGVVPPDAIKESYCFDAVAPPLDEKSVSRETKKEELRNWVRLLLDSTTDPLTFDRTTEKVDHDMRAFIGALATSALFDCGLEAMKDVCDWDYPRDNIPSGGWLHNYIPDRVSPDYDLSDFSSESDIAPVALIDEQFDAVHTQTLALAKEFGFWSRSDPLKIGADMFRVDWTGDDIEATVGRPPKADNEAVTAQWTFLVAGGIETESRFVLGGRLLPTLDEYPTALDEILSSSFDTVDIDSIFIDSETVSGELIKTVRRFAGDDWVISAPDHTIIKGLRRLTPRNYIGFAQDVKWNIEPMPNVVTYPYDSDDPDIIEIDPGKVLTEEIQYEDDDEKIAVPYDIPDEEDAPAQAPLDPDNSIPMLTEAFSDVAGQDGVGINRNHTHATYLTDRSLRNRSAAGIRYQYIQRWAIEPTINQIVNDFMPHIKSKDDRQRLYGMHIAILFYNWHTLINRCLSPRGLRLDITHTELLQAIREVAFEPTDYDAFWSE
ncbi:hypothetical protein [Natranaeroarchaeum sulfidigenes]|uniref:IS4 transposase n=1 Tax=Natranaeroarchaeum sulfidigenes TaxID=2784880 RepID=A0A897N176_9EURY|nr:hypothetical protein [Natranaeroarchaeum sulfidigenes]QSG04076.1 IS4 transposase [Natranaeroarchaeum sulfidigenes]